METFYMRTQMETFMCANPNGNIYLCERKWKQFLKILYMPTEILIKYSFYS